MHVCEECGARYSSPDESCARRFDELLALDHSRREPWGSRHGQAFAAFALEHPRTHPRSLDAAWDSLYRIYCLNEVPAVVFAARRENPTARPVAPRPSRQPTAFAVTIADLGEFEAEGYPAALDAWCRAALAAWGAPVIAELLPAARAINAVSTVRFREATSADVPAMERCRALDREAGPADARMAAYLDGNHHPQHALPPRVGFLAFVADDVVGYVAGHATTRYSCSGEVQYLYVTPAYRRFGVARGLLSAVAGWFDANDIHRVCVNADVDSDGAVAFYVAQGARPLNKYWYVWENIALLPGLQRVK